jgi:hypothetical protein
MTPGRKLRADAAGGPAEQRRAAAGWRDALDMQDHLLDQRCNHCRHGEWTGAGRRCRLLRCATGTGARCDHWVAAEPEPAQ